MKEAIIAGLVLSAVTGTCFVANNHPSKYRQLLPWAGLVAFLIMMCLGGWNVLVLFFMHRVHEAGLPFVVESERALRAIDSTLTSMTVPWWGVILPWLYFGFMWSMKLVTGLKASEAEQKVVTESKSSQKSPQKARSRS